MKYENNNCNETALVNARNLFQKAIAQDSTFAKAYIGLGEAMWDKNVQLYRFKNQYLENFTDSILILANRAIDYDSQLAEAYRLRGTCYLETGKIEQAEEEFDKAIELDPNDWESYFHKGRISHYLLENFAEGIQNYLEAVKRIRGKEYPNFLMVIGHAYQWAGFFDQTKKYYTDVLSILGDSVWYFSCLSFIEQSKGNLENALNYTRKANKIDPTYYTDLALTCSALSNNKELYPYYKKFIEAKTKSEYIPTFGSHRIGFCYWKLGNLKEANYYFNQQIKYSQEMINLQRFFSDSHPYYDLAATYAFLGNKDEAYKNLDILKKRKSFAHWWVVFLKNDPLFDNIRKEPRFQKIVSEIESKYLAEHERTRKKLVELGIPVEQKELGMHLTP
jgi:tetratricopeptide (TPR) repeat protein